MPVGFTAINDSGIFQIDENSFVLSVMESGDVSSLGSSTLAPGDHGIEYTFTTNVNQPIFGVYIPQATNYCGGISSATLSGSTWTVKITLWPQIGTTRTLTNMKYFVFGRPTAPGSSGVGIEVRDSSSNFRFSSERNIKTIAGGADVTINAAKRYAIVGGQITYSDFLDIDFVTTDVWTTHAYQYGKGYISDAGGIRTTEYLTYDFSSVGSSGGGSTATLNVGVAQPAFAIDVTEYTT